MNIIVVAMYKFVRLADHQGLRMPLLELCEAEDLKGTILLAEEGLNATVAGSRKGIDKESGSVLTFLHSLLGSFKFSHRSTHRHIVDAKMIADLGHCIRT